MNKLKDVVQGYPEMGSYFNEIMLQKWWSYFEANNISLLEWPARLPDTNTIENLWGDFARGVYAKARQLSNMNELKEWNFSGMVKNK